MQKRYIFAAIISLFLIIGSLTWYYHNHLTKTINHSAPAVPIKQQKVIIKSSTESVKNSGQFDTSQHSLSDASSIWVVVNKQRPLSPIDYVPADLVIPPVAKRSNITSDEQKLRSETASGLKTMFEAAAADAVTLNLQSGYRSYNLQTSVYQRYVGQQGKAVADSQSARPGHSEHQTGLAADIGGVSKPSCNLDTCFAATIEGKWLEAHAFKYGFFVRYPSDKTTVTGYIYEPWHVRYVGISLSSELQAQNISTLEEYFKLGAAPDYN